MKFVVYGIIASDAMEYRVNIILTSNMKGVVASAGRLETRRTKFHLQCVQTSGLSLPK